MVGCCRQQAKQVSQDRQQQGCSCTNGVAAPSVSKLTVRSQKIWGHLLWAVETQLVQADYDSLVISCNRSAIRDKGVGCNDGDQQNASDG